MDVAAQSLVCFIPGTPVPLKRLGGTSEGLDVLGKRKISCPPPTGFKPRTVQHVD